MAKEIFQILWQDVSPFCGTTGTPGDVRVDCQPGLGMHASSPVSDRFLRFTSRARPAELLAASIAQESIRVPIQALSTVASTRNCRTASETKDISPRWIDLVEINQCLAHSLRLFSLLCENSSQGYCFLLLALQTSQLFYDGVNYAAQSQTFSWTGACEVRGSFQKPSVELS